ncbi:hypothetical protein VTJ49DRAFT_7572 [Mycothermus thermophilus]|uniref:Hyaluronan/mRNA-binding protein domain-containing protein n=1 Tax=Humicola insolens TaxID=85995 RepID=A0ABR3VGU6_HUMIN
MRDMEVAGKSAQAHPTRSSRLHHITRPLTIASWTLRLPANCHVPPRCPLYLPFGDARLINSNHDKPHPSHISFPLLIQHNPQNANMTRSHKFNDKDHAGLAEGTAVPHEPVPKYFGKNGFPDADPNKTKKNGAGRANWGTFDDDLLDENFNYFNARRRSNSSTHSAHIENFKTKFEINEPEPVFEESMGPEEEERTESSSTATSTDENKSRKSV